MTLVGLLANRVTDLEKTLRNLSTAGQETGPPCVVNLIRFESPIRFILTDNGGLASWPTVLRILKRHSVLPARPAIIAWTATEKLLAMLS